MHQPTEDALFAEAQRIMDEVVHATAAPAHEPTPPPIIVRIEPGSTAINVGNVHIGSQTINQAATPTQQKGR